MQTVVIIVAVASALVVVLLVGQVVLRRVDRPALSLLRYLSQAIRFAMSLMIASAVMLIWKGDGSGELTLGVVAGILAILCLVATIFDDTMRKPSVSE